MSDLTAEELRQAAADLVDPAGYAEDHPVVGMLRRLATTAERRAARVLPSGWYVFTAEDTSSINGDHTSDPEWYETPTEHELEEIAGDLAGNYFSWGYRQVNEDGTELAEGAG